MTMGSKEGLASMATAMTAPGDVVLAPQKTLEPVTPAPDAADDGAPADPGAQG
jgi:aspartate/methionine/tyrosine aminotransferase